MKIVLLSGVSFEALVNPADLWLVCSLVKKGSLEAVVVHGPHIAPVRKIDLERTFGDLIAATVHDTAPPDSEAVSVR